ncbi:heavy-metal-associated domain-containing protein [Thermogemmatispora onikobensis]|uniref:heavy-metal-associated domain-containing protein n=1 Tax=Thermogemmatispora onikobensis TaxID=732234 RepID=UPI00159EFB24|nr:heavy-metal-associated domain-containing protein [Thermogemmatispora onikobensis]
MKREKMVDAPGQKLATVVLHIPSLRCGGCLKRVADALGTLPGLEIVATALPTRTVTLRYAREELGLERIAEAVRACGHVPGELREADGAAGEQRATGLSG